ncbi:MAG: serine/threonine protein kinase [Anaerolineae bacterium]|jgi:serine/threonine-protein kinase|nr:serine/threonine protein kinase [Anaerolineae bacterium]
MVDSAAPPLKVVGPYLCLRLLGVAASNAVYLAQHQETGRKVALRLMSISLDRREAVIAACTAELAKFAALALPGIVHVDDFGSTETMLYMIMPYLEGGSLKDRLRHAPALVGLPAPGEVVTMLERVAQALAGLHAEGIVHGQVEPGSVLFDAAGQAFLADVGVTRLLKIIYSLEATNSFNTNRYTAPELWEGERPQPATDQYALACMAYELLTGRPPFDAPTIFGLMKQHMDDVALPPHYLRETLPSDLAMCFWQALAKPPGRRYAGLLEFTADLQRAIAGREGTATGYFTVPLPAR